MVQTLDNYLFVLLPIRWSCCFARWYWLGDSLSAWRRNNPVSVLFPINSWVLCGPTANGCNSDLSSPTSPWDVLIVIGTLAKSLDGKALASKQGKGILSWWFAFSMQICSQLHGGGHNCKKWFCSWFCTLLPQHLTVYLERNGVSATCLSFLKEPFPASRISLLQLAWCML